MHGELTEGKYVHKQQKQHDKIERKQGFSSGIANVWNFL